MNASPACPLLWQAGRGGDTIDGRGFTVVEWLFKHPVALIAVCAGGAFAVIVWLAAPVTWRNSEGSIRDEGENTASTLRWMGRLLRW